MTETERLQYYKNYGEGMKNGRADAYLGFDSAIARTSNLPGYSEGYIDGQILHRTGSKPEARKPWSISIYPVNSQIGSRNWDIDSLFRRDEKPYTFTVWKGDKVVASGLTWPEVRSRGFDDYDKFDVCREK